jgi:formylglycine-generating enzyme required for sulfatase activity
MGLKPLQPGGIHHKLLDLARAAARQQAYLADARHCFEWIEVAGGTFWMGDDHHRDNEKPSHQVELNRFYIARHPVTNRLLADFPQGEKYPDYGGDSHPAIGNTWFEAYYFALWVDARLPTEAEWEYAARGGKQASRTQYFHGDDPNDLAEHAWYGEPDKPHAHAVDKINPRTGKENLNPLGLSNILGNVWEWCADWYDENYYADSPAENPRGPETGVGRVIRGGGWFGGAPVCRSADRDTVAPGYRDFAVGFRLARSVALGP